MNISTYLKRSFQLVYLLVFLNLILFLIVYHRLILIDPSFNSIINDKINNKTNENSICFIPQYDPWDQTITKSLRIKPLYQCPTHRRNLINIVNSNQLMINQYINKNFYFNSITHCVYFKIDRNPEEKYFRDWTYSLTEPILIQNNLSEPIINADFVLTRCYNNRKGFFHDNHFCGYNCSINQTAKQSEENLRNQSLVYEYVHPIIRRKKEPFTIKHWLKNKSPMNIFSKLNTPIHYPPSIVIIMLDAVSNLQAQRALPRTLAYLKTQGLYTFQRHAIVGDGTFENIVPMLFGQAGEKLKIVNINDSRYEFINTEIKIDPKTKKEIKIKKLIHYPGPYDSYPFIVKNFSRFNYTTFFSEEWRESAFYNLKNGFRQSPTDFYLRPYWLALYETISYNRYSGNSNPKPCYLDKLLHMLSLNWLTEFLSIHYDQQMYYPTFGIIKMNEMSHDYLERLFWIDDDLKNFFENLFEKYLLNNTIVIFCGDHGHRQHNLRLTRIGSFEVKLPFFSMLLPSTFKNNFPQAVENLEKNQKRLTSWWDVYETFANILKMLEEPHLYNPLHVHWRPTTPGISLFHPIPDRNCSTAGIPNKYCPCTRSSSVDITSSLIKKLTLTSIDHINNVKLEKYKHLCFKLELKTIIRAEVEDFQPIEEIINKTLQNNFTHAYTILFEVSPSDGIFESRLLYHETMKTIQLDNDILRINLYGQTSSCIKDQYNLRSFCYCIHYHRRFRALSMMNRPLKRKMKT